MIPACGTRDRWAGFSGQELSEGTAMLAALIRDDREPEELRVLARRERDGRVSARLLALANALEGTSRDARKRRVSPA